MKKLPTLRGRTVVNLFEDSARTRISFEAAASGFRPTSSTSRPGSAFQGRIPERHGIDVAGDGRRRGRDPASGQWCCTALANSDWIHGAVINAGDGTHEHPTQALLDAYTMRDHLRDGQGSLEGLNVVIVGMSHSAGRPVQRLVARHARGRRHPGGAAHFAAGRRRAVALPISYDLDEAIVKADVVMMLRVQMERMNAAFFPSARSSRRYGLTSHGCRRCPITRS